MKRVIPGLLLAIGWLLLLMTGSFLLFWAVVMLVGLLGSWEYCRMTFPADLCVADRVFLALMICMPIGVAAFAHRPQFNPMFGVFLGFCGMVGLIFIRYGNFKNPLSVLYQIVLGLVFVGFLAAHLVYIHALADGAHWLAILTGVTAGSDTAAFLVGSRWGRRKLCPVISPKKTVEGAVGGVAGGVAAAVLLALFFPVHCQGTIIVVMAVVLSFAGMAGDLLESVIKRGTGSKDSGRLLAGHGGVLDRVDSLLLSAPVLYYLLTFTGY